jgi:hypothetical protein
MYFLGFLNIDRIALKYQLKVRNARILSHNFTKEKGIAAYLTGAEAGDT